MENVKVLVVDDDSFVREILVDILQCDDYEVITAEHGVDAYEQFCKDPEIEVIVSDINMPVMGGVDLIKKLRNEAKSEVPLIVLSGNDEVSVAIEAINSGASDYLLKDENLQETVSLAIEKAIEKKRIVDQNRQLMKDITKKNGELKGIVGTLTEMGTLLSSEKDFPTLMEIIITNARGFTRADAATLYLIEDGKLAFKIVQNETLKIFSWR